MKVTLVLIFALAVIYRFGGNQWGLVTGKHLIDSGYPLESEFKSNWIVAGYVYDEERFMGSMHFLPELKKQVSNWLGGKITLGEGLAFSAKALWPGSFMQMRPVGPYFFSTVSVAGAKMGSLLGLNDMHPRTLKSLYYKINRVINAFVSACTLWVVLGFIGKSHPSRPFKWPILFGALIFCFQPASVVHGHWVTYNSLLALIKLGGLLYLNYICTHINEWSISKYISHLLILSLSIGFSIGAKFTAGVILMVAWGALLILGIKETGKKDFFKKFWSSRYFLGQMILIAGVILFFALSISPLFLINKAPEISFSVEGAAYYSRTKIALHYFLKTLPAGMGWPCYLLGLVGLASAMIGWKKLNLLKASLISLVIIMIFAFTSNSLGMQPQRSLTIYGAWVVFAVWGMDVLRKLRWRSLSAAVGIYIISGNIFASSLINISLIKDNPGYRTEASKYLMSHISPGENIIVHTVTKHGQIDVSYYETVQKPETAVFQYAALYTWQLDSMDNQMGYALYPDSWKGGKPLAAFHSSIKQESKLERVFRIFFGFHRADQIIDVPSFGIYRLGS